MALSIGCHLGELTTHTVKAAIETFERSMSGSGRPMQSVMSSDEHAAKPFLEQIAHQNKIAKLLFVREPRLRLRI